MQEVILKKVAFGGYDCADVMNHINALQIKLNRAKKDSEKLDSLRAEADRLKAEIDEKDREISELSARISEHEENVKKNQPSKLFLKQTEERSDNYIEAARSLGESVKELTAEQIEGAKDSVAEAQRQLDNVTALIGETYDSLSDLKKEYKSINKSYKEILNRTANEKKPAPKKTETKKSSRKSAEVKSTKKTSAKKTDSNDALELIRQTEEKYNNI